MANGEHENLNGLTHERINMRGYFERILAERDKRDEERVRSFNERFEASEKAVVAALAAAEKATVTNFAAAEKAIAKAETAQLRVNEGQNEFRATLKDQASTLMPRSETELLVKDLRQRIEDLTGTRREGVGQSADVVARFLPIIIAAVALITSIYLATHR